jgi:multidrug efflux pump subunit AcrA (membrane-fusion protein)
VPLAYIHRGEQGHAHVMVVNQTRQTAQMRPITLGSATLADSIEVADGLHPGDRIIAADPTQIRDGQRVRIIGEAPETAHAGTKHGGN